MKRFLLSVTLLSGLVSCSSTGKTVLATALAGPIGGALVSAYTSDADGIASDALAPYSPASRIIMINTTQDFYSMSFDQNNSCLYFEIDDREDKNVSGTYRRESETEAVISITLSNGDQIEYKLTYETENSGTVEEKHCAENNALIYTGTFTM